MHLGNGAVVGHSLQAVNRHATLNLHAHIARCEANYARFLQLLKGELTGKLESRSIEFAGMTPEIRFQHKRISAYTSTVTVRQDAMDGIPAMHLRIQLYHDTRAAEVVGYQGHQDFRVLHGRPRPPMTHRFEKVAMSEFLSELLEYCLTNSHATRDDLLSTEQGSS